MKPFEFQFDATSHYPLSWRTLLIHLRFHAQTLFSVRIQIISNRDSYCIEFCVV
jgi:hypothetical protein